MDGIKLQSMHKVLLQSLLALCVSSAIAMWGTVEARAEAGFDKHPIMDKRPIMTNASIRLGVYDPHNDFKDDSSPSIEHVFMPWADINLSSLDVADNYALAHHRSLMLTIEPWSWVARGQDTSQELYDGIMAGRYDANMAGICAKIAQLKSPVVIRWGQEMDDKNTRFVWTPWTPTQFVNAYRHVVTECREHDKAALFMWSPAGRPDVAAYYPGDDYVDLVGLTLFGLQQRDRREVGHDRSFEEMLKPLYGRVAQFDKPVYIAEFGYDGDAAYVRDWAGSFARPMPQFPLLEGVVYFNDVENYPWPGGYGFPNWRVVSATEASGR